MALRALAPADREKALGLCGPVPVSEFGWDELEFYIVQLFATKAMFNCTHIRPPRLPADFAVARGPSSQTLSYLPYPIRCNHIRTICFVAFILVRKRCT